MVDGNTVMKSFVYLLLVSVMMIISGCLFQEKSEVQKFISRASNLKTRQDKINFYDDAIKMLPSFVTGHIRLSEIYSQSEPFNLDKAYEHISWVTEALPFWGKAHYNRGWILWYLGKFNEAKEAFASSIKNGFKRKSSYLNHSLACIYSGDYENALNSLNEGLILKVEDRDLLSNRAALLYSMGDITSSLEDYNILVKLSPKVGEYHYMRSLLNLAREEISDFEENFKTAVSLAPNDWKNSYISAMLLISGGRDLQKAVELFDKSLSVFPENIGLLKQRGQLYFYSNEYKGAYWDFNRIVELNGYDLFALFFRGLCRFKLNDLDGSEKDYRQFLAIRNELNQLQEINEGSLQTNKSSSSLNFRDAFSLDPKGIANFIGVSPQKHWYLDFSVLGENLNGPSGPFLLDVRYAERLYSKVVEKKFKKEGKRGPGRAIDSSKFTSKSWEDLLNETDTGGSQGGVSPKTIIIVIAVLVLIGLIWSYNLKSTDEAKDLFNQAKESDDPNEILELLNQAIDKNPFYRDAFLKRGKIKFMLDEFEEALEDMNRLIQLSHDNGEAYRLRGKCKKKMGEGVAAKEDYKMASRLKDSVYYVGKGIHRIKNGDSKGAIPFLDRAIFKDPESSMAYSNRGVAKSLQEMYEEALEDYDKAVELDPLYINAYKNRASAYEALEMNEEMNNDIQMVKELEEEARKAKELKMEVEYNEEETEPD